MKTFCILRNRVTGAFLSSRIIDQYCLPGRPDRSFAAPKQSVNCIRSSPGINGNLTLYQFNRRKYESLVAGESKTFPTQKLQRRIHDFVIGVSRGPGLAAAGLGLDHDVLSAKHVRDCLHLHRHELGPVQAKRCSPQGLRHLRRTASFRA